VRVMVMWLERERGFEEKRERERGRSGVCESKWIEREEQRIRASVVVEENNNRPTRSQGSITVSHHRYETIDPKGGGSSERRGGGSGTEGQRRSPLPLYASLSGCHKP
jgi:hypothetical protein